MIPDGIEPIVAWRYWTLEQGFWLSALNHREHGAWVPNEPHKACCAANVHEYRVAFTGAVKATFQAANVPPPPDDYVEIRHEFAPSEGCSCGIYAAASLSELRTIVGAASVDVVGEVYLWGKVIKGERGYRAEYAYPKSLFLLDENLEAEAGLLCYGVDVGRMERSKAEPVFAGTMRVRDNATFEIVTKNDGRALLQITEWSGGPQMPIHVPVRRWLPTKNEVAYIRSKVSPSEWFVRNLDVCSPVRPAESREAPTDE